MLSFEGGVQNANSGKKSNNNLNFDIALQLIMHKIFFSVSSSAKYLFLIIHQHVSDMCFRMLDRLCVGNRNCRYV